MRFTKKVEAVLYDLALAARRPGVKRTLAAAAADEPERKSFSLASAF
jgi:hypothetical protein